MHSYGETIQLHSLPEYSAQDVDGFSYLVAVDVHVPQLLKLKRAGTEHFIWSPAVGLLSKKKKKSCICRLGCMLCSSQQKHKTTCC